MSKFLIGLNRHFMLESRKFLKSLKVNNELSVFQMCLSNCVIDEHFTVDNVTQISFIIPIYGFWSS